MRTKQRDWIIGFGPIHDVKPGERRLVDAQPKCRFRGEKLSPHVDPDIHITRIFVGKEEQLGLNGDSISLAKKEIVLENFRTADPAMPIQIEFENRGKTAKTVDMMITGKAWM